jgi:hypothetical protein
VIGMQTAPTDAPPSGRRVTPYRVAATLVLVGVAALWAYALTRQPEPPPDQLDDATFAVEAEQVCQATRSTLDQLPLAFQTSDPVERADVVVRANTELAAMLAALREQVPPATRDARMLDEWLTDWGVYLDNRRDYADRLRAEGDTRIYVAEKDGRQVTVAVDRFAEVNDMPACRTPKDIS